MNLSESPTFAHHRPAFGDEVCIPPSTAASAMTDRSSDTNPPWRVLLVDDDQDALQLWSAVLRALRFKDRGVELIAAQDLVQARSMIAMHPDIAVTVLDVVMPGARSGLDLVHHIRNELHDRLMRIVVATGHCRHAPALRTLCELEVNAYLDKGATDSLKLCSAVLGALRSHAELSELQGTLRSVSRLAMTDSLTGLSNRLALPGRFRQLVERARRDISSMALVFIDIDDFKTINDRDGHRRGDEVLRAMGAAILACARGQDQGFRYGGDEFIVVLHECTAEEARDHFLPRLSDCLRRLGVQASCGITELAPPDYPALDMAIHAADADMYRAKQRRKRERSRAQPQATVTGWAP